MKARLYFALFLASLLLSSNAEETIRPAAPIEIDDFQEVAGILAWSFRLPEGVGADEYARLEWIISLEDGSGRVEPSGISFPELGSNGEIKIFLWVEDLMLGNRTGIQSIPYCVKTRGIDEKWEKRKGTLQLPKGFGELYGFEKNGPSDLHGFVMLISAENDQDNAFLNLGYAPISKD